MIKIQKKEKESWPKARFLTSAWWIKNSHDALACPVRMMSPASCTKYPEREEGRTPSQEDESAAEQFSSVNNFHFKLL